MNEKIFQDTQLKFIINSEEWRRRIADGDKKGTNQQVKKNDDIVAQWKKNASIEDLLFSLVSHASLEVRFAAATYLIDSNHKTIATQVLKELAADPKGVVAVFAQSVLRGNNIS